MREMTRVFLTLLIFSFLSGGLLATVYNSTQDRIEYQQLKFVKGPTIKDIMEGCSNDPVQDRFSLAHKGRARNFFVGVFEDDPEAIAFEAFGKGYGGDIGVMVGVNLETDKIVGVGVTTHSETPGVGARTKTDPDFAEQFEGLPIQDTIKVKADSGQIDAVSGATISSRGVCQAVNTAGKIYREMKPQIRKRLEEFKT